MWHLINSNTVAAPLPKRTTNIEDYQIQREAFLRFQSVTESWKFGNKEICYSGHLVAFKLKH